MRDILQMEPHEFNQKIIDWAIEFGFTIEGDYLVTNNADVDAFVHALDDQFSNWDNDKKKEIDKL